VRAVAAAHESCKPCESFQEGEAAEGELSSREGVFFRRALQKTGRYDGARGALRTARCVNAEAASRAHTATPQRRAHKDFSGGMADS
jgi:hypothetical protein